MEHNILINLLCGHYNDFYNEIIITFHFQFRKKCKIKGIRIFKIQTKIYARKDKMLFGKRVKTKDKSLSTIEEYPVFQTAQCSVRKTYTIYLFCRKF